MNRAISLLSALALLRFSPAGAAENNTLLPKARTDASPLHLEPLLKLAVAENPGLKAIRHRAEAADHVPSQAGSLPDPKVGIELSNVPLGGIAFDQSPMTGIQLKAMQRVPYPGKLRLKRETARHAADALDDEYDEAKNRLLADVKKTYFDLYNVDKAIALTLENKRLLDDFVKIAEARYAVGKGTQHDVLKAQVALSRIVDDLLKLKQQRITVQAKLNILLNRPPNAPVGRPVDVKKHEVSLDLEALFEGALDTRPKLAGVRDNIRQVETALKLARRNLKPDFEFGAGYRIRSGNPMDAVGGRDFYTLSAAVILPFWADTKQKQRIAEVHQLLQMWRQRYAAEKDQVFFEIRDQLANLDRLDKQERLFRTGIIPQAEIALSAARAAYQVGKIDFLTLLDSQKTLYNYQIRYYRVLTDHEKALAELERVIGARLF